MATKPGWEPDRSYEQDLCLPVVPAESRREHLAIPGDAFGHHNQGRGGTQSGTAKDATEQPAFRTAASSRQKAPAQNVRRLRLKNPERRHSANRALDRPEHGSGSKNTRHPNKHACAYAHVLMQTWLYVVCTGVRMCRKIPERLKPRTDGAGSGEKGHR